MSLQLQEYLHTHIPLSKAMQVAVVEASENKVTLGAPLGPNINHRSTVFGGSASAVAILAAWALVHQRLQRETSLRPRIVIQRNTMEYSAPITTDFEAECALDDATGWAKLLDSLRRKGIGRITLESRIFCTGTLAGLFTGTFVVSDLSRS